jgi:hypothetical protein
VKTARQGGLTVKAARGGVTVKAPSRERGSPRPPGDPRLGSVSRGPSLVLEQILDPSDLSYPPKCGRRLADTERHTYFSGSSTGMQ